MEDSFSVSIPGGCQWQALWNLRTGRGHCPPALYQVWKCLHWNMSGLHQRPSGQHRNQSHQSHRWRGTQVQRAHWEETGTQVSILLLLWDWCCTLLYRRGCMQQHKQKGRDFSGILWMTKLSQQLASPHPVTVFALKAISCLLPAKSDWNTKQIWSLRRPYCIWFDFTLLWRPLWKTSTFYWLSNCGSHFAG